MLAETAQRPPRQLGAGQVDVWLTFLSDVGQVHQHDYEKLLSESEQIRWRRFIAPAARLQYLVARALLRSTLESYTGVPHYAWQFATNAYGRPYIQEPRTYRFLQFNLSHTRGLVACAMAAGCELGLDVDDSFRDIDVVALAPRVLAPPELEHFAGTPSEQQRNVFFSYWTLKEAYIKARGMGLSIDLGGFWFDLSRRFPCVHFTEKCPDNPLRWQFRQYAPSDRHRIAIALSPAISQFDIRLRRTVPLQKF